MKVLRVHRKLFIYLLSLVYGNCCEFCGCELETIVISGLCPDCIAGIEKVSEPFCTVCGIPFCRPEGSVAIPHRCSDCISEKTYFTIARSATPYADALRKAVHIFKYKGNHSSGELLSTILVETFLKEPEFKNCDLVSFVPLHHKRKRERGFNQSEMLAKWFGRKTGLPVKRTLKRKINTSPQTSLSSSERRNNIKGAFTGYRPEKYYGKSVLVIDDIYTTGATVRECSKTLIKSGAESVFVLTVARTL